MNLKIGHLIAVQFGILIGIVACLVFLHFDNARSRTAAEMREPGADRTTTVASKSAARDESTQDYRNDFEPAESLTEQSNYPLPNEYSPENVEKSRAILTKLYYEQISPRRNANSMAANNTLAAVAPAYTQVAPEPAAVQADEPVPQTVAYAEPTQVIVYPQQVVAFARPRRFGNRCQPNALASNPHRRRDHGGTQVNGVSGFQLPGPSVLTDPPRTPGMPNCPSTPGFTPRGKRERTQPTR